MKTYSSDPHPEIPAQINLFGEFQRMVDPSKYAWVFFYQELGEANPRAGVALVRRADLERLGLLEDSDVSPWDPMHPDHGPMSESNPWLDLHGLHTFDPLEWTYIENHMPPDPAERLILSNYDQIEPLDGDTDATEWAIAHSRRMAEIAGALPDT